MNFFQDRVHLKTSAKDKLIGKYSAAVSIILLSRLLQMVPNRITSLISINTAVGLVVYLIVTFGIAVVIGIMELGLCLFFLSMACDQPFTVNQLFYGFKVQTNKALCISAIISGIQMICISPGMYCFLFYLITFDTQLLYPALWLLIIGLLICIPIALMLSQSFYIMLDFPDMTARETIKYSVKVMKGHKIQLFYLQISFIPLMLLTVCTMGIGLLWLLPYMTMTNTLFYLDLMHPSAATSDSH